MGNILNTGICTTHTYEGLKTEVPISQPGSVADHCGATGKWGIASLFTCMLPITHVLGFFSTWQLGAPVTALRNLRVGSWGLGIPQPTDFSDAAPWGSEEIPMEDWEFVTSVSNHWMMRSRIDFSSSGVYVQLSLKAQVCMGGGREPFAKWIWTP